METALVITEDTVVRAAQHQVSCNIANETVVLQLAQGIYYGLNPVGAAVWNLVQTPKRVADVQAAVLDRYDVESERCSRDVRDLLQRLAEAGLIEVADEQSC